MVDFLAQLQEKVDDHLLGNQMEIYTYHKRGDQIFRAHLNFRGGVWRDWVWVNYGPSGEFPCHIWCFVVIPPLPKGFKLHHGGVRLEEGTFAVVESAAIDKTPSEDYVGDIMQPILKDVVMNEDGKPTDKILHLANTEAFVRPCCVIPDIGGLPNRYFIVASRDSWPDHFQNWLLDDPKLDKMDPLDDQASSEEEETVDNAERGGKQEG